MIALIFEWDLKNDNNNGAQRNSLLIYEEEKKKQTLEFKEFFLVLFSFLTLQIPQME